MGWRLHATTDCLIHGVSAARTILDLMHQANAKADSSIICLALTVA